MCRFLYIRSDHAFAVAEHLDKFAELSKNSKEYQGHGWGCAYLQENHWQLYKNIKPIWEDDLQQFATTRVLIAHARSAFEDRDIKVENNMPFTDDNLIFVFNGELRGVKIRETGRIGAEKIFNFIKRFDKGDMRHAIQKGTKIITTRTEYIRAMNFLIADRNNAFLATFFNSDPDYFTVWHKKENNSVYICSAPYPGESSWTAIANQTVQVF
jgi:glutamine amidotransferase